MILAGILHDTYTDKIIGCLKGNIFNCVSIPDMMTFDMSKKDFMAKVTDIQEIWSK